MKRTLKIEATGDFFRNRIKPLIRIKGNWLANAGFPPNARVVLTSPMPGAIQLTVENAQP